MKWIGIFIASSISILLIVIIVFLSIPFYFGGDSNKNLEILHRKNIQKEVVTKIHDFKATNGRNPMTLSEIGLEQTVSAYTRDDMVFYLIPDTPYFILQCWDENYKEYQYISEMNSWIEDYLWEFEPPINVDTIWNINRILALTEKAVTKVDSARINTQVYPIIDCYNVKPDSIALLSYYYPNGELMMQGWVAYHFSASNYDKEFGEWKYYDQEGNCYRKFQNYKQNGKLIYEADR